MNYINYWPRRTLVVYRQAVCVSHNFQQSQFQPVHTKTLTLSLILLEFQNSSVYKWAYRVLYKPPVPQSVWGTRCGHRPFKCLCSDLDESNLGWLTKFKTSFMWRGLIGGQVPPPPSIWRISWVSMTSFSVQDCQQSLGCCIDLRLRDWYRARQTQDPQS